MARPDAFIARTFGPEQNQAWDAMMRKHALSRTIVPKWDDLAGWTPHEIGLFRGEELIGGLTYAVRRIPMLPVSLGRISRVMIGPARHSEMLEALLGEVERFSKLRLVVETELRLRIPGDDAVDGFEYHRDLERLVADFGYRALSKIDTTYLVAIDRDDETLLKGFESKARNSIRKALKSGALVRTSDDASLIESFYDSYVKMSTRKKAPLTPKTLVVQGLKPAIDLGYAELYTESYDGKISNMVVIDALGIPYYALGTRTEANVKGEVHGAAQVLHYEIMKRMRDRGKKFYDLGGCEGPVPIEGHPNFGVWRFKYNFGGAFVRFLPYYRKTRGPTREVLDAVHKIRGDYL
jgi:hypothetical protein